MHIDPGLRRADLAADFRHLIQLAAAQLALARLKESRLKAERQQLYDLQRERSDLMEAIERGRSDLMIYSAAARRLTGLDLAIRCSGLRLEGLCDDVIKARARHDVLIRRARDVSLEQARKDAEAEALEVVQSMQRNAPHKDSMLD